MAQALLNGHSAATVTALDLAKKSGIDDRHKVFLCIFFSESYHCFILADIQLLTVNTIQDV